MKKGYPWQFLISKFEQDLFMKFVKYVDAYVKIARYHTRVVATDTYKERPIYRLKSAPTFQCFWKSVFMGAAGQEQSFD